KRKMDDLMTTACDTSNDAKQRCMDGSKAAECIIGIQHAIKFSKILFTTNVHVPVPLPFFQNTNLRYMTDYVAMLI
ncbi:hypothetical protein BYT27DRAFT_7085603, partial [Phlegmacium glaucopus]